MPANDASTDEPVDFVEIYHTASMFAAQKILDTLLHPAGINAVLRDRLDHPFPTNGQTGGVFVAVPSGDKEKALTLIEEALADGFLEPEEGETKDEG